MVGVFGEFWLVGWLVVRSGEQRNGSWCCQFANVTMGLQGEEDGCWEWACWHEGGADDIGCYSNIPTYLPTFQSGSLPTSLPVKPSRLEATSSDAHGSVYLTVT